MVGSGMVSRTSTGKLTTRPVRSSLFVWPMGQRMRCAVGLVFASVADAYEKSFGLNDFHAVFFAVVCVRRVVEC